MRWTRRRLGWRDPVKIAYPRDPNACVICGAAGPMSTNHQDYVYVSATEFISLGPGKPCVGCWQRHLDLQPAVELERKAETKRRVAAARAWLKKAPRPTETTVTLERSDGTTFTHEHEFVGIDDLAKLVASEVEWSSISRSVPDTYYCVLERNEDDEDSGSFGGVLTPDKHRYKDDDEYRYADVFRAGRDQMLITWHTGSTRDYDD